MRNYSLPMQINELNIILLIAPGERLITNEHFSTLIFDTVVHTYQCDHILLKSNHKCTPKFIFKNMTVKINNQSVQQSKF